MPNSITGKIKSIGQSQQVPVSDPSKSFDRRELILDCTTYDHFTGQPGKYNPVSLEFTREGCQSLDPFSEGDIVTVYFSVRGFEYTDKRTGTTKIFTKLNPYKIERVGQPQQPAPQPVQQPSPVYYPQQQEQEQFPSQMNNDNFPF